MRHFSKTSLLSLLLPLLSPAMAATEKPNVLFLFTDDQRFDTIHALGNERIKTPHIDRLANNGISFRNAYIMGGTSMAVCTPSRACLFSGRSLWQLANQGPWDFAIPEKYKTMAQVFRDNGYTSFATGKNDPGFGKNDHFTRSFNAGKNLYYRGGHRGQTRTPIFNLDPGSPNGRGEKIPTDNRFNADLFADACVEFLNSRKGVKQPFFAYVPFMTPHDPLNCPQEYMDMYQAKDMKLPENYMPQHPFDAGVHHIRDERLMKRPLTEDAVLARLAKYYALVSHTDAQIGRILEALDKSGHADNTIIVFASDNGLGLGSHGLTGKQNVYEHGVKVPFIVSGPGIAKGQKRDQLCYIYDIYPTLCDMASIKVPDTVQYKSLKPVFQDPAAKHRESLYFSFMQWQHSVRDERYKLIEFCVDGKRTTRLFDLKNDPAELNDLAVQKDMQTVLKRLRRMLESKRPKKEDLNSEHYQNMSAEFWDTYQKNS